MAHNNLFQYSLVSALMDGIAEAGIAVSDLLSHGNHGLGTFLRMSGEMIILDGIIYQMNGDGSVEVLDIAAGKEQSSPFAMITQFQPTVTTSRQLENKEDLAGVLTRLLPKAKNHYLAFRVDGVFKSLTVRTVGGQNFPGEGLSEIGKRQASYTFENIRGTMIGFRSPLFMQGISVAGDHAHFISAKRNLGGHVLTFESKNELDIAAAPLTTLNLCFPGHEDFDQAQLLKDDKGISEVEG